MDARIRAPIHWSNFGYVHMDAFTRASNVKKLYYYYFTAEQDNQLLPSFPF